MTPSLRAATVQFQHRANDKNYNLSTMERFITEAAEQQIQLLAFPEMCITGYWHVRHLSDAEVRALAEPIASSPSLARIRPLAERYNMAIGVGLIELGDDGRCYNAYAVCLPDGELHVHRKLHAFEHPAIASGDRYTVFDTPGRARGRLDLLGQQSGGECARHGAAGRGGVDRPAPDRRHPFAQPARHEADPAGAVATACGRSAGNRSRLSRRTRPRLADALATVARSRQRAVLAVQQRRGPR